jgi:hypothetical protein
MAELQRGDDRLPVDRINPDKDGDDSLRDEKGRPTQLDAPKTASKSATVTVKPPVVPFVRPLTEGTSGNDVLAVKRALSRAGYIKWGEFTRIWGKYAAQACKNFQRAKGLKQTGVYHYATHEALRKTHRKNSRTEWAFDKFSIAILKDEEVSPYEMAVGKTLDAVTYAIVHNPEVSYSMARPMPDRLPYPNLPYAADCSGFVTWAARSGGWVQDPNYPVASRRKWDGWGFTGTLWEQGEKVSGLSEAKECDLVFYGKPWEAGASAHVTILRDFYNSRWYVGSHGQQSGPSNVPATYRVITGIRRYKLA